MFAVCGLGGVTVLPKDRIFVAQQFWAPQNAVLVKPISSRKSTSCVCKNASEKSLTVSYLINSCGLSSKDAISASEKLRFESPEKPDAVLKLLREYGFTDAHIRRMVVRWPKVLICCPMNNLSPKLHFFRSIGFPLPVLAQKLSADPSALTRSLENSLIPSYNELKSLLQSDERVVRVFSRAPWIFGRCWSRGISSNISMLRERGVPESSIVSLVMYQPSLLIASTDKLTICVDRVVEMGFDISKSAALYAIRAFACMGESTLEHKMEVFRRCGWSDSNIVDAFLRFPFCFQASEEKIMAKMDFLVREFGCKPLDVARYPVLLSYSLDKRIKPRCLVARILNEKGMKKMTGVAHLLNMSEKSSLKRYIVKYQNDIPELLDIYRGKSSPFGMDFSQEVVSK